LAAEVLSAAALGVCIGLAVVGLIRFPRSRISAPLIASIVCATLWSLGSLITDLAVRPVWNTLGIVVAYTGGTFLPVAWWTLSLRWSEQRELHFPLRGRVWLAAPLAWATASGMSLGP